jgi:catechol 2,3-dioxygenase-like lactoylglutathione lyase family enzyme
MRRTPDAEERVTQRRFVPFPALSTTRASSVPPEIVMPPKKRTGSPSARSSSPYFASIAVVVSDRRKAVEWYTKALGLDLIDSEEHWVTVGRKGREGVLHLCQTTEFDTHGTLEPGNSGICLRLPGTDFEANCSALKARGVEFARPPEKSEWGWWAMIRDPDGNEHLLAPES